MSRLLTVLLFISTSLFAGEPKASDFKEQLWGDSSPEFQVTDVPADWADHGAIIIAQEFVYRYEYAKANKLLNIETSHVRMKLQDATAVEAYSEFYYSETYHPERGYGVKGRTYVGFKVIKENGKVTEVPLSDAVTISESDWEVEKKIAIPNLEKGDIIDFYYATVESFIVGNYYIFNPVLAQLNDEYPLMYQRFRFETEKYFFINFAAMNGAPPLKKTDSSDKKLNHFEVENGMQEPNDGLLWEFGYRTYPTIKFQVIYGKKGEKAPIPAFLGEPGVVKESVTEKDVLNLLESRWSTDSDEDEETYKAFKRYLRYNDLMGLSKDEKLQEFYYYLRYQNSLRQQTSSSLLDAEPYDNLDIVSILANYMLLEEIDFELLLAVGRTLGTLDNLVIKDEIEFILKSGENYFHDIDDHSHFGDISSQFEGAEAWIVNVKDPVSQWKGKQHTLSISPQTSNTVHGEMTVSLDENDPLKLRINRVNTFKGKSRGRVIWILLLQKDYEDEDRKKYMLRYRPADKADDEVDMEEKRMEALESIINNDFDVEIDEVHNFEIHCNGRYPDTDSLNFTEEFTAPGLMKRAGNNLLLQAGMLIGGQIEIGDEERERKSDIYMPYARSFSYNIVVNIPDGYTVEGVDKLNYDVFNETGGFRSSAKLEDGKLLIKTRKQYNANFESLENWPQMIEFLEAAYSFTQQRVLFKKN